MKIFIDTAVTGCNLALFDGGNILAHHQEPIERGHAETLLPLYQTLLKSINKSSDDITDIYTTVGPGSFTGLRVGLTVAKFMGLSLNKPVRGISTFQAFSSHIQSHQNRLVVVEPRRTDYFYQILDANHRPLTEAHNGMADSIEKIITNNPDIIVTGDAVSRLMTEINTNVAYIEQTMIDIPSVCSAIHNNKFDY